MKMEHGVGNEQKNKKLANLIKSYEEMSNAKKAGKLRN